MFKRISQVQGSMTAWATLVLLGASVVVNVTLATRLRAQSNSIRPSVVRVGQVVRPISVLDEQGRPASIRFDRNVPTVIYYFSPSCGWCEKNWANINAIASNADGRYRVVGVAAEPVLTEFLKSHTLPFEVFGGASSEAREALGLTGTPRTVVVSAQGLVSHEWTGAYTGPNEHPVEDVFGIALPGLSRPETIRAPNR